MARMNYSKLHQREQMRRCGFTNARGEDDPDIAILVRAARRPRWRPRKAPPSKDELRQQAAAAFIAWRQRQASQ